MVGSTYLKKKKNELLTCDEENDRFSTTYLATEKEAKSKITIFLKYKNNKDKKTWRKFKDDTAILAKNKFLRS